MVQRMARGFALLEIPGPVVGTSSTTGCKGAGFFEESDEERFDGWEARGYDADVHFDDLPDVC
jgi:hypothetical protein